MELRANKAKCTFFQDSVAFLGHKVDAKGLHTTSEKVEAIKLAPRPKDQSQPKSFLGLSHYYSKFLPNLAALLHVPTEQTASKRQQVELVP